MVEDLILQLRGLGENLEATAAMMHTMQDIAAERNYYEEIRDRYSRQLDHQGALCAKVQERLENGLELVTRFQEWYKALGKRQRMVLTFPALVTQGQKVWELPSDWSLVTRSEASQKKVYRGVPERDQSCRTPPKRPDG